MQLSFRKSRQFVIVKEEDMVTVFGKIQNLTMVERENSIERELNKI